MFTQNFSLSAASYNIDDGFNLFKSASSLALHPITSQLFLIIITLIKIEIMHCGNAVDPMYFQRKSAGSFVIRASLGNVPHFYSSSSLSHSLTWPLHHHQQQHLKHTGASNLVAYCSTRLSSQINWHRTVVLIVYSRAFGSPSTASSWSLSRITLSHCIVHQSFRWSKVSGCLSGRPWR